MLKPIPSARLLRALRASIEGREFTCRCPRTQHFSRPHTKQYATEARISPATSINSQRAIPEEFKELHERLSLLEKDASIYIDISQVQLALKNLESKQSVTRIAVLGVNNEIGPLKLVRALLADPLSSEEAWEKELQHAGRGGKPLLIRSGMRISLESSHPLLNTLTLPSVKLEQHKVEILVQQVEVEEEASVVQNDMAISTLLSPNLYAQQSFTGRTTGVTYPVHKAVILGHGLKSVLPVLAILQSQDGKTASKMVQVVTSVDWQALPDQEGGLILVNMDRGQHAIDVFRQDLKNAIVYEKEWLSSGLPSLASIMFPASTDNASLKPPVQDLINHVLDETELAIARSAADILTDDSFSNISEELRDRLQNAITTWAERAHTELQADIATVTHSRGWKKLAWWKLLWRVDDVEMITSEVIRRTYLNEAEKSIIFMAGRITQAGLLVRDSSARDNLDPESSRWDIGGVRAVAKGTAANELVKTRDLMANLQRSQKRPPWPSQISLSRLSILEETIPPFTALAQRYLLSSLSLSGLATAISALAYVGVSGTSLYEAGAVAALGIVFSARRLQTRWEAARMTWIQGLEVEGKRVLDSIEKRCRIIISDGGRSVPDTQAAEDLAMARDAVAKVRATLAKLTTSSKS